MHLAVVLVFCTLGPPAHAQGTSAAEIDRIVAEFVDTSPRRCDRSSTVVTSSRRSNWTDFARILKIFATRRENLHTFFGFKAKAKASDQTIAKLQIRRLLGTVSVIVVP